MRRGVRRSGGTDLDTERLVDGFFLSFANTIAGGSSEIQRNIIAQRVLALADAKDACNSTRPSARSRRSSTKLADMSLSLERATAAVQYAAMTVDAADAERTRACNTAQAVAGEAARRMVKDGIQIHGGIGYTWEHDPHLYLRRATGDEHLFGTTGWHHHQLAASLFDT